MGVGWGGGLIFSEELHIFPFNHLHMYIPNIKKPANKEASNYQEGLQNLANRKNSGMMWKWGRLWEATTKSRWYTLSTRPQTQTWRASEASATVWRNLKLQGGFWIHVIPNNNCSQGCGLSLRSPLPKASTCSKSHCVIVTQALEPAPGPEVRAIRTSTF